MSAKVGLISLHLLVSLVLAAAYYTGKMVRQSFMNITTGLWAVSLFVCILMYIPSISKGAIYLHLGVSAMVFLVMMKMFMDNKKKTSSSQSAEPFFEPTMLDVSFWAISLGVCIALSVVS
tara:strand:- start:316 stop:675 length:360 start_codon:yes stop_codon:yes gene_type:complete